MTRMVKIEGNAGKVSYVNAAHVRLIKASHHDGMCRLVLASTDKEEESLTVVGTMEQLAAQLNE